MEEDEDDEDDNGEDDDDGEGVPVTWLEQWCPPWSPLGRVWVCRGVARVLVLGEDSPEEGGAEVATESPSTTSSPSPPPSSSLLSPLVECPLRVTSGSLLGRSSLGGERLVTPPLRPVEGGAPGGAPGVASPPVSTADTTPLVNTASLDFSWRRRRID